MLERKIVLKGQLGSRFLKWKPTNREERLTITIGLIIKSSMKAFWNIKDRSQSTQVFGAVFTRDRLLMLYSMFDFPENAGDSRKLKNVQENYSE